MPFLVYCPSGFVDSNNNKYTPDANGWITAADLMALQPLLESNFNSMVPAIAIVCTTAKRPTTNLLPGMVLLDSTLNKPIFRNSTNSQWIDSTGATV